MKVTRKFLLSRNCSTLKEAKELRKNLGIKFENCIENFQFKNWNKLRQENTLFLSNGKNLLHGIPRASRWVELKLVGDNFGIFKIKEFHSTEVKEHSNPLKGYVVISELDLL